MQCWKLSIRNSNEVHSRALQMKIWLVVCNGRPHVIVGKEEGINPSIRVEPRIIVSWMQEAIFNFIRNLCVLTL